MQCIKYSSVAVILFFLNHTVRRVQNTDIYARMHVHTHISSLVVTLLTSTLFLQNPLTVSQQYYVGWPFWIMEDHLIIKYILITVLSLMQLLKAIMHICCNDTMS